MILAPSCDTCGMPMFFLTSGQPMRPTMTGEALNARSANVGKTITVNWSGKPHESRICPGYPIFQFHSATRLLRMRNSDCF